MQKQKQQKQKQQKQKMAELIGKYKHNILKVCEDVINDEINTAGKHYSDSPIKQKLRHTCIDLANMVLRYLEENSELEEEDEEEEPENYFYDENDKQLFNQIKHTIKQISSPLCNSNNINIINRSDLKNYCLAEKKDATTTEQHERDINFGEVEAGTITAKTTTSTTSRTTAAAATLFPQSPSSHHSTLKCLPLLTTPYHYQQQQQQQQQQVTAQSHTLWQYWHT